MSETCFPGQYTEIKLASYLPVNYSKLIKRTGITLLIHSPGYIPSARLSQVLYKA